MSGLQFGDCSLCGRRAVRATTASGEPTGPWAHVVLPGDHHAPAVVFDGPITCGRCGSDAGGTCPDDVCPMRADLFAEPGRWIDETGAIRHAWPPEGRFAELWRRICDVTSAEERIALKALISHEVDENSTLVAYTDRDGEWHGVEPNWDVPKGWT